MFLDYKKYIIALFMLMVPVCLYEVYHLKFSFDFEQFFPEGDPDLDFFYEFIDDFETDDNFLMIALPNEETVFEQEYLDKLHAFTLAARNLPHVKKSQSLTTMDYPVKTPFGISTIPIIHRGDPSKYAADRERILQDDRFVNNLINKQTNAMTVTLRTEDALGLEACTELMQATYALLDQHGFEESHFLGRAFFTEELVRMQKREIVISTIIAGILVTFILILIFQKPIGVFIALSSIGMGLLLFMGAMGILGREFNAMAALYPVIMLIVGTSDVIHIMSKYVDELKKGKEKRDAMIVTIKQIGLATLYTSLTTAIGFATLYTSNVRPIKEFGVNAAMGVMIAYITVIFLTTSTLIMFDKEQIIKDKEGNDFWERFLGKWYQLTLTKGRLISISAMVFFITCLWGMSMISTNYRIESNLPIKAKITDDFRYFEESFSGFRPLEFAITVKDEELKADSYEVLKEVSKLEDKLREDENLNSVMSITSLYKSIERMNRGNTAEGYVFPENKKAFLKAKKMVERVAKDESTILISKDRTKTRISTRLADIGAERIKAEGLAIDQWINSNIDTSLISVKRTGTGLIIDKNAEFIRDDLLYGLGIALLMVSLLMALLFRKFSLLIIALIPNLLPVVFAAALLGFLGIDLEAGVSIVFAVVFGIAVDDTIHFLSKYKIARSDGYEVEEAIKLTFMETGKAITFTTIILFFGFLVMFFSNHPPSVTVGLLISVTLIGAWICDLFLMPVIMRKFLK